MSRPIKYYDTRIDATRSAQEIGALVQKYGGSRFELQWDGNGGVRAVRFAIRHPDLGEVPIFLTAPSDVIRQKLPSSWDHARRESQAQRIAWRHLKDLTEQLLLSVSLGLKTLPSAFLAEMEMADGVTVGQQFSQMARIAPGGGIMLIGPGGGS